MNLEASRFSPIQGNKFASNQDIPPTKPNRFLRSWNFKNVKDLEINSTPTRIGAETFQKPVRNGSNEEDKEANERAR